MDKPQNLIIDELIKEILLTDEQIRHLEDLGLIMEAKDGEAPE